MIKLTRCSPPGFVFVAPQHITALERMGEQTCIHVVGSSYLVTEYPDEIIGMPEMQYHLFPAMVVGSSA